MVRSIAAEVRAFGHRTWLDIENLAPGQSWRAAIESALDFAEVFVACVSPLSLESLWTSEELERALARGVPILPILLQPVSLSLLPPALQERQVLDVSRMAAAAASKRAAQAILDLRRGFTQTTSKPAVLRVAIGHEAKHLRCDFYADEITPTALERLTFLADQAHEAVIWIGLSVDRLQTAVLLGVAVSRMGPKAVTVAPVPEADAELARIVQLIACRVVSDNCMSNH